MKEQTPITVVVLGDIHSGSRVAVMPSRFRLSDGSIVEGSPAQGALHKAWDELATEWNKPDVLILNGDCIEGQSRKENGVGNWTNDLDEQLSCCVSLVSMFEAKHTYCVNGTGYHVDAGGKSLEHHLGRMLGAEQWEKGVFSGEQLFLKVGETVFDCAHHIQVGTGWYRTTPLAREMMFARLNESDKHRADIILRSHVHNFAGVEFDRQRGYTVPCWQLQTRYMLRKGAWSMIPTIGGLRFRVYQSGEVRMDKRRFRVPEAKPKLFTYGKAN